MSGAGKTTACALFGENGFTVVNCDEIVRETLTGGSLCLNELKERFSENIIKEDGGLDRKKTASLIFNDFQKKHEYEQIVFPYVLHSILNKINTYIKNNENDILLDAPTLFESGADGLCGKIVSVICSEDTAIERIMKRDSISRKEASSRVASQKSAEYFKERSDFYIENDLETDKFIKKINEVIKKLRCKD